MSNLNEIHKELKRLGVDKKFTNIISIITNNIILYKINNRPEIQRLIELMHRYPYNYDMAIEIIIGRTLYPIIASPTCTRVEMFIIRWFSGESTMYERNPEEVMKELLEELKEL